MKLREIVFLTFCATWFGCSWFQNSDTIDPNSDEVQKACVVACTAFVWTACGDNDRSLDQYMPVGEMIQLAETVETCSQECMRISDHLEGGPAKLECLSGVDTCEGVFECLDQ